LLQALCQLKFVCSEAADVLKLAEWLHDNYSLFLMWNFVLKVRDFLLPLVQGLPDPIPQSFSKLCQGVPAAWSWKWKGLGRRLQGFQSELFKHAPPRFKQNHLNMQYVFNTRQRVCTLSARERSWVLLVTHAAINKFILLS